MATKRIYTQDFYQTTLASATISASWDVSFDVVTAPDNKQWWIIISPDDSNLRERMYYYDVVGNTIYVRGTWRFSAKWHTLWETIKINDVSNIFNYFSDISSSAFYTEKISWTTVKVWWWDILKDNVTTTISDTTITLSNDQVSYIYLCKTDNSIKAANSESAALNDAWVIVSDVTCGWWSVSSIIPRNYKFSTFTITAWPAWAKWDNWDIGNPSPTWQTISDNVILWVWDTVEIIWSTIKITRANWVYTIYSETDIKTYDSTWALVSSEVKTWTFASSIMTYTDWMTVNWVSWLISFTGSPAYRNKTNRFTENNVFTKDVNFEWRVSFWYHEIVPVGNVYTFDWTNWTKQVMNVLSWNTMIISFTNLYSWANYEFVINNNTVWPVTISKWTITYSENIVNFYSIGWTAFLGNTNDVGIWTHLFVCEAYSTAIHISYLWESQGIA